MTVNGAPARRLRDPARGKGAGLIATIRQPGYTLAYTGMG